MITVIKGELSAFIEGNISSLNGKTRASYNDAERLAPPSCVIDIVFNTANRTCNRVVLEMALARISVVSNNEKEVDQLVDEIKKYFTKYAWNSAHLTHTIFRRVESVSPVLPAFFEKDGFWRRDIDISIYWQNTS